MRRYNDDRQVILDLNLPEAAEKTRRIPKLSLQNGSSNLLAVPSSMAYHEFGDVISGKTGFRVSDESKYPGAPLVKSGGYVEMGFSPEEADLLSPERQLQLIEDVRERARGMSPLHGAML